MKVDFNRLDRGYRLFKDEFEAAALRVLNSGWYVLGAEVDSFESEFAETLGAGGAVGVNSGLDALTLSLRALGIGPGDEVIVPGNSFIASALAITESGATPVLAEPNEFHNLDAADAEQRITDATKAIMVVHLYGQAADMDAIGSMAERHGLPVVEDCAQSHFVRWGNRPTGTFGVAGCFSFYPTKNLGCFGDGGAVVSDDPDFIGAVRMLRNYGSSEKYHHELLGVNSRLDEMQAALLRVKLGHRDVYLDGRRTIADRYLAGIRNAEVTLPRIADGAEHAWHLFVLECARRDALTEHLAAEGVATQIHYPIPAHLSECYSYLGYESGDLPVTERLANTVLSLPIYDGMTDDEIDHVIASVNSFEAHA